MTFVVVNPTELRKAAAFVNAISEVEEKFGYTLAADPDPIAVGGASSRFGLIRDPEGGLGLTLEVDK